MRNLFKNVSSSWSKEKILNMGGILGNIADT
jgi:hypothetical protein